MAKRDAKKEKALRNAEFGKKHKKTGSKSRREARKERVLVREAKYAREHNLPSREEVIAFQKELARELKRGRSPYSSADRAVVS
jgi:hypothetical protein